MAHKAFVFEYERFAQELCPLIASALDSGDVAPLRRFIEEHLAELVDPADGSPLDGGALRLDAGSVDAHADIALTRYYDPSDDIGLGSDWQLQSRELERAGLEPSILLGRALTRGQVAFDPGRMGSYFQSSDALGAHLAQVRAAAQRAGSSPALPAVIEMLERGEGRGLYVTF